MALAGGTIWEVQTGGSDTLNGGAFDPTRTAGMFTDGAAAVANTSGPVFTSASYNFIAGDVGAWVYIASGTNWTPGWYKVASVAASAATLNATISQAVTSPQIKPSTVVGCATVASPTAATWSIDYSQQAAAQFTYTDLASSGAGLTVSSAAKPFAKQHVGNAIVITGGTNFNTGRYVIASVAAAVATVLGPTNITSGVGASGTGGQGGALASVGLPAGIGVADNEICIQSGAYNITSASTNVSGGCVSQGTAMGLYGYGSVRGDLGTPPVLTASGISTATIISTTNSDSANCVNITVDGASLTSIRGFTIGAFCYKCWAKNCTNSGFATQGTGPTVFCRASGCTTAGAGFNSTTTGHRFIACHAAGNSVQGFLATGGGNACMFCVSSSNSGASSYGFNTGGTIGILFANCVAYANGASGFRYTGGGGITFLNCIAESNGAWGWNGSATVSFGLANCAAYNNTSGSGFTDSVGSNSRANMAEFNAAVITGSGSFFTNAASGDFSLNNTAGAGALLRATGFLGSLPDGLTAGYQDIGVAQHADPVVLLRNQGMDGGMNG